MNPVDHTVYSDDNIEGFPISVPKDELYVEGELPFNRA